MSVTALQFWPRMRRVERAAWNAIVRCLKARKLDAIPLPIPVESWIEGPLDIRFGVADLSALGPNVLGRSLPTERQIEVSDTLVDQEARFRFTAAHELGHVLLHAGVAVEFREDPDADFYEKRIEREADRFAAAFLMPIPSLTAELLAASQDAGLDASAVLAGVAKGEASCISEFRRALLPRLAYRFGVSLTATAHRFSDVELATGELAVPPSRIASVLASSHPQESFRRP